MLEIDADYKITNDDGNTILMLLFSHYALVRTLSKAKAFLELSSKLINKEGDINKTNDRKKTAAMIAISSGIGDAMFMALFALMEPRSQGAKEPRSLNVNSYDADGHSAIIKEIIFPGMTV